MEAILWLRNERLVNVVSPQQSSQLSLKSASTSTMSVPPTTAEAAQTAFVEQLRAQILEVHVDIKNNTLYHLTPEGYKLLYGVNTSQPDNIEPKDEGEGGDFKTYPDNVVQRTVGIVFYTSPDPHSYIWLYFDNSHPETNTVKCGFVHKHLVNLGTADKRLILNITDIQSIGDQAVHGFYDHGRWTVLTIAGKITQGHLAVASYELSLSHPPRIILGPGPVVPPTA